MIRFLILLTFLLFNSPVASKSFIWQIEKNNRSIYLGGTVHLLRSSDYPLPCEFYSVYNKSNTVVFETHIKELQTKKFQKKLAKASRYSFGKNLSQKLNQDTLSSLKQYIKSKGLPERSTLKLKPGILMSVLINTELHLANFTEEGVDEVFLNIAIADNKKVASLETPEQQLKLITNMGLNNENNFIRYILKNIDISAEQLSEMINSWRVGDINSFKEASQIEIFQNNFPVIFYDLVNRRNNQWMPIIEEMLTTHSTELVLVGALHLIGKNGLISQLKDKGYTINQINKCLTD